MHPVADPPASLPLSLLPVDADLSRFPKVRASSREAAFVPESSPGMMGHIFGSVLAAVTIKPKGLVDGKHQHITYHTQRQAAALGPDCSYSGSRRDDPCGGMRLWCVPSGSGADETLARAAYHVERGDLSAGVKELETLQVRQTLPCCDSREARRLTGSWGWGCACVGQGLPARTVKDWVADARARLLVEQVGSQTAQAGRQGQALKHRSLCYACCCRE